MKMTNRRKNENKKSKKKGVNVNWGRKMMRIFHDCPVLPRMKGNINCNTDLSFKIPMWIRVTESTHSLLLSGHPRPLTYSIFIKITINFFTNVIT